MNNPYIILKIDNTATNEEIEVARKKTIKITM